MGSAVEKEVSAIPHVNPWIITEVAMIHGLTCGIALTSFSTADPIPEQLHDEGHFFLRRALNEAHQPALDHRAHQVDDRISGLRDWRRVDLFAGHALA